MGKSERLMRQEHTIGRCGSGPLGGCQYILLCIYHIYQVVFLLVKAQTLCDNFCSDPKFVCLIYFNLSFILYDQQAACMYCGVSSPQWLHPSFSHSESLLLCQDFTRFTTQAEYTPRTVRNLSMYLVQSNF